MFQSSRSLRSANGNNVWPSLLWDISESLTSARDFLTPWIFLCYSDFVIFDHIFNHATTRANLPCVSSTTNTRQGWCMGGDIYRWSNRYSGDASIAWQRSTFSACVLLEVLPSHQHSFSIATIITGNSIMWPGFQAWSSGHSALISDEFVFLDK